MVIAQKPMRKDIVRSGVGVGAPAVGGRQLAGIVVNHTHWDREWYMPFQRYRVMLVDAVDMLLETLESRPDYEGFMLDGQTVVAEDYLEVRPEKREELAGYLRSGRVVMGPWYVLPDEFLPSAEGLIRNLLLGRKQMRELGAPPVPVGYLPDTFGHPAQLPQVLAGFDLDSAVIFRGVQSDTSEFVWEAPDGTALLTIYLPGGYFNAMEMARAPRLWLDQKMGAALAQAARFATSGVVLLMNGCDHFLPQPVTQEVVDETNGLQDLVRLRQGTLEEYIDLVRRAGVKLPVRRGEWRHNRPARITPGVLSSRMYLKQADFRSSIMLERGAEPLQAIAWALGGSHDTGLLSTAWRYLLQNHPHDSICGCSIDAVHQDCEARYRWVEQMAADLTERAATSIARRVRTDRPGFAVFNTLASARSEVVRQRLHFLEPGARFSLVDSEGRDVPYQEIARRPASIQWDPQRGHFHGEGRAEPVAVVGGHVSVVTGQGSEGARMADRGAVGEAMDGGRWRRWFGEEVEVLFHADLPAGGYSTVRVKEDPAEEEPARLDGDSLEAGPDWLENELVRMEVGADGSFELLDKSSGRRYGPLNVFRSEADRGDEYSFCPVEGDAAVSTRGTPGAEVELVERGPLRATLEVRLQLPVPSGLAEDRFNRVGELVDLPIRTRISLHPNSRRVEIRTELENRARDHRLRVLFDTGVESGVADAQGQFEVVRRPVGLAAEERARVPEFDEEQEVSYHPQRAFVDVSDRDGGLAVLNRGLPEYEAEQTSEGVCLGVTLLRCVGYLSREDLSTRYKHAGPPLETPEAQCPGVHVYHYAVVPHAGDWLEAGVAQEAEAYVTPVHTAPLAPGNHPVGRELPLEASFYQVGPGEMLFSACKRSEDGESVILRAYNGSSRGIEATVHLEFGDVVRRANLAERKLSGPLEVASGIAVRPNEIVTLCVGIKDQGSGIRGQSLPQDLIPDP